MVELSMSQAQAPADRQTGKIVLRWVLYIVLVLFALFYLLPLFVMLTTSLKSLEEIRTGDLVALPREVTFDAWAKAWSGACTCFRTSASPTRTSSAFVAET